MIAFSLDRSIRWWARSVNMARSTLRYRLSTGMELERALTLPLMKNRAHCPKGHVKDGQRRYGGRYCKACQREAARRRRAG